MRNWIKELCLWPYLLVVLVFCLAVKSSTAHTNRLNYLKGAEEDISSSLNNKKPLSAEDCLWAIRYYVELAKMFPNNDIIAANKGFCYFHLGNYEKAAAAYDEAIKLKPYIYTHYFDRGIVAWKMRDVESTVNFFIASLKIMPQTKEVYDNIMRSLQGQKADAWLTMLSLAMRQMQKDQEDAYQKLMLFRQLGGNALEQDSDELLGQQLHFHSQFMIMMAGKMNAKNF